MEHKTKLSRQGNTNAMTLTRAMAHQMGWDLGDELIVKIVGDHIEVHGSNGPWQMYVGLYDAAVRRYPTLLSANA
ncbi:MAG: hypothetical protein ACKO57_07830 [Alphaproteobacteria bacterium]